jgi:hypothetical protein
VEVHRGAVGHGRANGLFHGYGPQTGIGHPPLDAGISRFQN